MEKELIGAELLKMDRLGRVHVPAERREALLDEFERCGVSAAQFAKRIGVNYTTFAAWRQKRARRREAGQSDPATTTLPALQWVEAVVEQSGSGNQGEEGNRSIWIELPGGVRVEMRKASEAKLVAALLRAVADKERLAC